MAGNYHINLMVSRHLEELAVQHSDQVHPSHHHQDGPRSHTNIALGVESYNLTFVTKRTNQIRFQYFPCKKDGKKWQK